VEVFPQYEQGLEGLEGFSHIILLYVFHCSEGYSLMVTPFLDDQQRGLFATRHPCRPNPLGLSIVRLLKREGNWLEIEGWMCWTRPPCWTSSLTCRTLTSADDVRTGWYERRSKE
jgi:tRNA (adenine37-N6)-methyltransferase